MAEKILERHAISGQIEPGRIIRARVDCVLLNDVSSPLSCKQFCEMGATRVAEPERVVLVCDHFAPRENGLVAVAGQRFSAQPCPPFLQELIHAGGLVAWVRGGLARRQTA